MTDIERSSSGFRLKLSEFQREYKSMCPHSTRVIRTRRTFWLTLLLSTGLVVFSAIMRECEQRLRGPLTTSSGEARRSVCLSIPRFETVDESPVRSPLLIADHLIGLVDGKSIFEIGTRNGDILACVAHFAKHAYSAEIMPEYCTKLEERGLTVLCGDFMKQNLRELPTVPDVYFWWPMTANSQNDMWLTHLRQQHSVLFPSHRALAVIAFDHQWAEDEDNRVFMLAKYNNSWEHVIDFYEGDGPRSHGKFSLVHFPF